MGVTRFAAAMAGSISGLAALLRPSANGATFSLIAIASCASTVLALSVHGPEGIALASVLCVAALVLLGALHWAIKAKFAKVSESLETIGLGELSGRAETILEGE